MQVIDREELLQQLGSVQSGLSAREIVEQSSCFIFKDGRITTFNDSICCSYETSLKIEGAIDSTPFLNILSKMTEKTIKISCKDDEVQIYGAKRKAGIRLQHEILLPIDEVDTPTDWIKLPAGFVDGVRLIQKCASSDESRFILTCVHIHPDWVEATDNNHLARITLKTGITSPVLVKKDSIAKAMAFDVDEVSVTESWIHFRNSLGLIFSCRKYLDDFPEMTPMLKIHGEKMTLPNGLAEAADKASVFSSDVSSEDSEVKVQLKNGKMRIRGEGVTGWFTETKSITYAGKAISFLIKPQLLIEITKEYNECLISESTLMVDGGKFVYVTCLMQEE